MQHASAENNEISFHEVRIYLALLDGGERWVTSREMATKAGVAERTSRLHCARLVKLGILDRAEVFPAHRFRISAKGQKRNAAYWARLTAACEVFASGGGDRLARQ